jgi:DNA mismatch repair protein MutS
MSQLEDTPLMRQWREIKARHDDALVFFRVGDFYELFCGDAEEGSRLLGLTLTSRNNGSASRVPLAGVPVKALDEYLGRLVKLGRRVAICDQVEDPALAKGIVRREVTETLTPGTILQDTLLKARRNNYLVSLSPPSAGVWGLAALDLSTGELSVEAVPESTLADAIGRLEPSEVLLPRTVAQPEAHSALPAPPPQGPVRTLREDWLFDHATASESLLRRYGVQSLEAFGFQREDSALVRAAGALIGYVQEIRPGGAEHLRPPKLLRGGVFMTLDEMTRRNLELVEPLRAGEEGGTLLSVLDDAVTAMGGRLLRQWILRPLVKPEEIWRRQDAVSELCERADARRGARGALSRVGDLERIASKLGTGRANPRELLGLVRSLSELPGLTSALEAPESELMRELALKLDPLADVRDLLGRALSEDAPVNLQDGGAIRAGYSPELDELRALVDGARDFIASLQVRERERTGIGSLKVGFNQVFGYYLEVTRANAGRVPADYHRKQSAFCHAKRSQAKPSPSSGFTAVES